MADVSLFGTIGTQGALAGGTSFLNGPSGSQGASRHRTQEFLGQARNALEEIKKEFLFQPRWAVPIPAPPAEPLVYSTPAVAAVGSIERGAPSVDVDAMAVGLEAAMPLNVLPVNPWDLMEMRDAVEREHAAFLARTEGDDKARALASAQQRNRLLLAEDAALLTEDLELHPLENPELPSTTLLRKPIYTELGEAPLERRGEARVAVPMKQKPVVNPDAMMAGQAVAGMASEQWSRLVCSSFKNARALDGNFQQFIDAIALGALGRTTKAGAAAAQAIARSFAALAAVASDAAADAVLAALRATTRGDDSAIATLATELEEVTGGEAVLDGAVALVTEWADARAGAKPGTATEWAITNAKALLEEAFRSVAGPESERTERRHRQVCLVHPDHPEAVPVSVLPLLPESESDAADAHQFSLDDAPVAALTFIGAPARRSGTAPHVVLGEGDRILRPSAAADTADGAVEYAADAGSYDLFKHDGASHSMFVLEVRADAVRYQRIPYVGEYSARPGSIKAGEHATRPAIVVWEDSATGEAVRRRDRETA